MFLSGDKLSTRLSGRRLSYRTVSLTREKTVAVADPDAVERDERNPLSVVMLGFFLNLTRQE